MPALLLIHKRKFQRHLEIFFNLIKEKVKLPRRPFACVTDGETGIINAMSVVPNLVDIRCWNHILQDCGRWLTDKGCSKKEINCYKDHLRCLFGQDSREKSLEAITSRKSVTGDNVTENTIEKPVTTTHDPAGPDWLQIGSITLKDEEKNFLYLPNAWLNDRIIDATQEMLKLQFPHIWSLDTCLKASNLSFKKARGNFIQVLNRDPQKGGSHWLTLSTMKMKSLNEIKIFDSAFTSMSLPTQQVVCQLLRDGPPKHGDKILLKFMDCVYQNNSDDCSLYAIANAVAEAFGIDPTMQEYDTELMREHLIHCLEQNELSLFPARSRESSFAGGVRYSPYLKVFCTCQIPEEGHYAICDKCNIWYHPSCEGLDINEIPECGVSYFCKKCLNLKRKKKR